MKARQLADLLEVIVRKVVREELKPIITEVRNASKPILKETTKKNKTTSNRIQKDPLDINISDILKEERVSNPTDKKTFVKNSMLNEMLNETMNDGEWKNMDAQFGSNQAQAWSGRETTTVAPTQDIDGRPVDTSNPEVANVMDAITKDYSQLMKAIDKKKGR
jgi:hypothetical protein